MLDLRGDVFGVALGAIPFGEIEMRAAAVHVALDQPGDWRDVRIPGPRGLIAMAVKTGAAEQFPGFRRIPRGFFRRGRIGVGVAERDELNQEGYDQHPFEDFDQHATQDTLVSHSDRLQIVDFQVIAVRISACAPRDFRLCGNALRGGFGKALRKVESGAYARWFEPRVQEGPSGLKDSPRGFVVRVVDRDVAAGEQFEFGVNLFDPLAGGVEVLRAAFEEMFRVERVAPEHLRLPLNPERAASRVRVSFVTPTELKGGERPEFGVLFARLRDRISTLRSLYQGGALEIDFKAMAKRAAAVKMTRCEIEKVEAERVSRNTGQRHSLGGFIGFAEYAGEIGEFLPYLEIGRYTGVGRQTVWGKGEIHAVVA